MEIPYLNNLQPGPLQSGVIVAVAAVLAILLAMVVHRIGIGLLRRLVRNRPFTTNATRIAFRASQVCVALFAVRVVLTAAPDDTPGLRSLSYVCTVALIVALTWFVMRCIVSVSATITQLNPYDVADNLKARRILTQTRVLTRSAYFIVGLLGLAFVLLTLPGARQFGASLLASAGVAGLVAGIAARPVLGNFIAGLQIAFSQPIRIDDVLIVNGEWGRVEEITGTFVVVRIWDERRMIVPLQWFIENPFENWTHTSSTILGTVFLWLDFKLPVASLRTEFERVCKEAPQWDGRVCVLQVTDSNERAMQVRMLVSAQNSGSAFDLRCAIRESMIAFIAEHHPEALPRLRSAIDPVELAPSTLADAGVHDKILDGAPMQR
ncbi:MULTISPECIES: mechanosensitive ion channel domain-containing protein [unclassified Herbaspirillum]|uniref:mechanosensitive ion channel family protein n=1 Tax=unclassified Herbaspirillum TaxID=2624150 RepID=UPI000E2E74DC|nr:MULTISPECIES: mechanosensitive ion channel domain-containing protein [unclassified Herbaspirillum]RFB73004.1 mechanosensitive ion channel family protein [Herbaspirillum sp. 3R-3a1]TFI11185.1 mechanosensitive ion channel [Herbaspirillum sp. 3R11]TFI17094.1 mechanosensitive ion channel [Herbaspirillum sp. 3R-11]TFI26696.1 mechanosensitive ion channel [Herbaspirillum sp. 3C11]